MSQSLCLGACRTAPSGPTIKSAKQPTSSNEFQNSDSTGPLNPTGPLYCRMERMYTQKEVDDAIAANSAKKDEEFKKHDFPARYKLNCLSLSY